MKLSIEEIAGVVTVLRATTRDELHRIFGEIFYMRDGEPPSTDKLNKLIEKAFNQHWLEPVTGEEIKADLAGEEFLVIGPSAFAAVPDELSEVIDMLDIDESREVKWSKVASSRKDELMKKAKELDQKIKKLGKKGKKTTEKQLRTASSKYNQLRELAYDYEAWLNTDLDNVKKILDKAGNALQKMR